MWPRFDPRPVQKLEPTPTLYSPPNIESKSKNFCCCNILYNIYRYVFLNNEFKKLVFFALYFNFFAISDSFLLVQILRFISGLGIRSLVYLANRSFIDKKERRAKDPDLQYLCTEQLKIIIFSWNNYFIYVNKIIFTFECLKSSLHKGLKSLS